MPTPAERRALILVTALCGLGVLARVGRATRARPAPTAAERRALDLQIARVESARAAQSGRPQAGVRSRDSAPTVQGSGGTGASVAHVSRVTRESGVTIPSPAASARSGSSPGDGAHPVVDIDAATAAEIEGLPYVGKVLAARIVTNRDSCGAFGSIGALTRVKGVGDGLARRLVPFVTFSSGSSPMTAARPPECARVDRGAVIRRRGRR